MVKRIFFKIINSDKKVGDYLPEIRKNRARLKLIKDA